MQNESVSLGFSDIAHGGNSDKVYHLTIQGEGDRWTVEAQYGRRGGALASQVKAKDAPYATAKKAFDKTLAAKVAKGYRTMLGDTPAPQHAPPTNGRTTRGSLTELITEVENEGNEAKLVILPPELLTEIENPAPFLANPAYWMQDKSDGVSRGVLKQGGQIFGINKLASPVALPAEIVAELAQINLAEFQIDAELVGSRLICRDLLVANVPVGNLPYYTRFALLEATITGLTRVALVETWTAEEKAPALEVARAEHREGVVFKQIDARYRAGRNGQHFKCKFIKTLSAIAGEPRAKGKDSVELFLWSDANQWQRCGTVSLIGKPEVKKGDVVEVAYLYAYPSGLMVQARLLRLRDDVKAEECKVSQLIMKREEAE